VACWFDSPCAGELSDGGVMILRIKGPTRSRRDHRQRGAARPGPAGITSPGSTCRCSGF